MKEETTRLIKGKQGYGYKYTDLAQIHTYLEENNMSYYQYIDRADNDDYIITVPIINGEEKMPRRGVKLITATLKGINNPAQEQGSAITYARRYSLLMAFGLATEDDDAACLTTKKQDEKETLKLIAELDELIFENNIDRMKIYEAYKVESNADMTLEQLKNAIKQIKDKLEKKGK